MKTMVSDSKLFRRMYFSFGGIAMICAIIIVVTFEFTAPLIAANEMRALERAIYAVQPQAQATQQYALISTGEFIAREGANEPVVYATYDTQDKLTGFAIPASGMGYQDNIRLLYGYDPQTQMIVGMKVLQSRETPGLGSKIETDEYFLANFRNLDVTLTQDQTALANSLRVVKPGKKQQPWQIDSISGATVSSKAVGEILQRSAAHWLPRIQQQYKDFERGH